MLLKEADELGYIEVHQIILWSNPKNSGWKYHESKAFNAPNLWNIIVYYNIFFRVPFVAPDDSLADWGLGSTAAPQHWKDPMPEKKYYKQKHLGPSRIQNQSKFFTKKTIYMCQSWNHCSVTNFSKRKWQRANKQ